MLNRKSTIVVRALPLLIAAAYAGSAVADEGKLEEVIVTAQKRAERLQDVPISISAIGGSQLETRGLEGARSIDGLVPNVTVKSAGPGAGLIAATSIRGLNSGQPAIWADPSIGLYLDGVFVGKNQGSLFDMADLERIEVLRGPQGTLFGRNTEGGAINFITRKPSGQFSGSAGMEIGNHGRHVERLSIDLPKMGAMSLSFALRNESQDGWADNPNGKAWGSKDRQAARLAASFDISPKFKVDYAYDRTNIDETPAPVSLISTTGYNKLYPSNSGGTIPANFLPFVPGIGSTPGGAAGCAASAAAPLAAGFGYGSAFVTDCFFGNLRTVMAPYTQEGRPTSVTGNANTNYFQKLDVDGHALTATYELNATNTLKYIGSYRKMHYQDNTDLDGTPAYIFIAGKNTHYSTYSHEFQWIGNTDKMNYVLGYYQFKDDGYTLSYQSGSFYTFSPLAQAYRQPYYRVTTDAKAVFAQLDYKLTSDLTATVGYRRTTEEKGGQVWRTNTTSTFLMPGNPGVTYQAGFTPQGNTASFSATTPVVALAYRLNDNVNIFGRMAKGFKSGGFSLEALTATEALTPFNPERSTAYELGVKTNFWDNKGKLNATIFRTDVNNFHVSLLPPGGTTPVIINAGKARTQGVELEGSFVLADGWKLQANYGYLDAKFLEYQGRNQYGNMVDVASNTELGYAPRYQLSLSLDGRLAKTAFGTLRGILDVNRSAKYFNYSGQKSPVGTEVNVGNSADESTIPAITTINARLLLAGIPVGGPGAADLSLWVRNLTDEKKMNSHIDVGGFYRIAGWTEPRSYGLSFGYKW